MLSVVKQTVIMLNVFTLKVVMLSVVSPIISNQFLLDLQATSKQLTEIKAWP